MHEDALSRRVEHLSYLQRVLCSPSTTLWLNVCRLDLDVLNNVVYGTAQQQAALVVWLRFGIALSTSVVPCPTTKQSVAALSTLLAEYQYVTATETRRQLMKHAGGVWGSRLVRGGAGGAVQLVHLHSGVTVPCLLGASEVLGTLLGTLVLVYKRWHLESCASPMKCPPDGGSEDEQEGGGDDADGGAASPSNLDYEALMEACDEALQRLLVNPLVKALHSLALKDVQSAQASMLSRHFRSYLNAEDDLRRNLSEPASSTPSVTPSSSPRMCAALVGPVEADVDVGLEEM
eukprot:PhM_4_TR7945/c0_g1_i1/m.53648